MSYKQRISKLEAKHRPPGPAPIVVIYPGDPIPEGAEVVLVDDICGSDMDEL